jgi:hypothetical protein
MKRFIKPVAAIGLVGALALTVATESQARSRWIGPAAAGFAAGAIVGGAIAGSRHYDGYYYDSYAYAPGYGYDAYGYAPGYAYETRTYVRPRYYYNRSGPHHEDQLTGSGIGASW